MPRKIEVLFFEGCPHHGPAMELTRDVAARVAPDVQVEEVEVRNDGEARRLRFLGSPTIRVDGVDIEPEARARTEYAVSCRMYGDSGVPPRELLEVALSENSES